jgi:GNAT superfamily N-acetyltransferase
VLAIRAVGSGDAADLRRLRLRALQGAPDAFGSSLELEQAYPAADWLDLARRSEMGDTAVVYVALDGDRWLGMAGGRWYDRDHGVAGLWGMWVDPARRRLGVGERLVDAVRWWAAAEGAVFLRLAAVAGDGDPTAFYQRLGFVRTGETGTLIRDRTRTYRFLVRPV